MIVPDVNLLVYAFNRGAPHHAEARAWWEGLVNGRQRIGICWIVAAGFVRIVTNPRVVSPPADPAEAVDRVSEWFRVPAVAPLNPGPEHLELFKQLLADAGAGGRLTTDAHIAALAIEYQAEVHSTDRDFGRFAGLRWRNPLQSQNWGRSG